MSELPRLDGTNTGDDLLKIWRLHIEELFSQTSALWRNREVFRLVTSTINDNPALHGLDATVTDWMSLNYAAFISTGIRRLVEVDRTRQNSVSIVALLKSIREHSELLSRDYLRGLYEENEFRDHSFADKAYSRLVGPKVDQIPDGFIQSLIDRVCGTTAKVEKFTDKYVAHWAIDRRDHPVPNYNDVDKCVDLLVSLVAQLQELICGTATQMAPISDCWDETLLVPWKPS